MAAGWAVEMGQRIEAKELRCQKRAPLEQLIPLPGPFVVYVDPTNACNFRCKFCPTGDPALLKKVGRKASTMNMDLFEKVLDGLRRFPKLRLINAYKDGEPLLHARFPEMIRALKSADVADRIWTKSNGALLSPELNRELVSCGLDLICISVEAVSGEGYRRIAGVELDYDRFRENVADLYARRGPMELYVKIADTNLDEDDLRKFYADFQPISTHVGVEKLMGWSNSGLKDFTLGTKPSTYDGLPFVPKDVCAYPFYVLAVNSDGSVSVCGNDWSHGAAVGNVREQDLLEIWNGDALFDLRRRMLDGERHRIPACADCYYLQIVPDNLDPYRHELSQRLGAARKVAP
jgi:radical SAM protein with 4Fe4S-binding SPASM domain